MYMYICDVKVVEIKDKGRGVESNNFIPRGQYICEYEGILRSKKEAGEMEKKYEKDDRVGCFMYYFNFKEEKYW